ncbi:hypothetical protein FRB95_010217 [Tulasnella sp. JGI-2019a]|nr:hypothetical protein FRB95_010217 [Tulasnella sp. JGI-2019a]
MEDPTTVGGRSGFRQEGVNDAIELQAMNDHPTPTILPTGWRYGKSSDLRSATGGISIPGNPHDFKVIRVTWWKERSGLRHEYLVLETEIRGIESSLSRLFVRIERHKWLWTSSVPDDDIRVAAKEEDLSENSAAIAILTIRNLVEDSSYYTLASIGLLLEEVSRSAPRYRLLTFNCFWLAEICFECILCHYGPDRISSALLQGEIRTGPFARRCKGPREVSRRGLATAHSESYVDSL